MRILFVFPSFPYYKGKPSVTFQRMGYPYVFRYLSSVTPEKYDIDIVDERFEKINFNEKYDIVGITVYTVSAIHAYELARKFKETGSTVILGGHHPTVLPEEAKQFADSVVIGEAEELWPQILQDFEQGKLKPFYRQTKPVDITKFSPKNLKLKEVNSIRNTVGTSRGCPNRCDFCFITNNMSGRVYRTRAISDVRNELECIKQKHIFFHDASMTVDVNRTKQLFKEIKDLNKRFISCGTVNVLSKDEELLKLASDAGCVEWFVGFESIIQENLETVGKKTNKIENFNKAIKLIHDYGMILTGAFIFGFDADTKDIFSKTYNAIVEMDLDYVGLHILTPYPGTPLFARLNLEGRIFSKDWSKYIEMDNVVFQPKNMTPQELFDGVHWIKNKFFTYKNVPKWGFNSIKHGFYPFMQMALKGLP